MNPPENVELFDTPLLNCWFGQDGILYSISKPVERTIENYSLLFELYERLSENGSKKICTLGDITNAQPLTKEVREFVSAEIPKYLRAMALIAESTVGKATGTAFQILSDSPYPVAVFDNKEDAVNWLKEIIRKEQTISQ